MIRELCDFRTLLGNVIPIKGWNNEKIHYTIIIDSNGHFINLESNIQNNKVLEMLVPDIPKRSGTKSYLTSGLLWDNNKYILNIEKNKNTNEFNNIIGDNFKNSFINNLKNFKAFLDENKNNKVKYIDAVLLFLKTDNEINCLKQNIKYIDLLKSKIDVNLTFKLDQDIKCMCSELFDEINAYLVYNLNKESKNNYFCSIYGFNNQSSQARLIPSVSVISGATQPGDLISFNENSFESYNFVQGENCNISEQAADDFTKSVDYLLNNKDGAGNFTNKTVIGGNTFIYWCKNNLNSSLESVINYTLNNFNIKNIPEDDVSTDVSLIKDSYSSIFKSKFKLLNDDLDKQYYIICLNSNVKRISITMFLNNSIGNIFNNIINHFDDLELKHNFNKQLNYNVYSLINVCFKDEKKENIKLMKNLIKEFSNAILSNKQYPIILQTYLIDRIKQEIYLNNGKRFALQVAFLKAILNRKKYKGITMDLNKDYEDESYLFGRLFAIYEQIQDKANNRILNSGIKENYYKSYISNPYKVLPILEKIIDKSLNKIKKNNKETYYYFNNLIKNIISKINKDINNQYLSLDDQSKLILGYYHQQTDNWSSK